MFKNSVPNLITFRVRFVLAFLLWFYILNVRQLILDYYRYALVCVFVCLNMEYLTIKNAKIKKYCVYLFECFILFLQLFFFKLEIL